MFKIKVFISALSKKMWPKVTLFALAAVITALSAFFFRRYIPDSWSEIIGADTVDTILNILASSMLAVTTFSLTTILTFYNAASKASPRATQLIVEDSTTQNVLATFLGSFLFSLAGLVALQAGIYGGSGRFILFLASLGVILLIVITLIRWIDHLTTMGRQVSITRAVEKKVAATMGKRAQDPYMGGNRFDIKSGIFTHPVEIYPDGSGYVQLLDSSTLAEVADDIQNNIYVLALPGCYVQSIRPLAVVEGNLSEKQAKKIRSAFTVSDVRSFDQDPRFGLCVLAEIVDTAVAEGVNDSGTAIDVIGRMTRVLAIMARQTTQGDVQYPRLWIPGIDAEDLFEDAFSAVARDGAALFEVQACLQKHLAYLASLGNREFAVAAVRQSRIALERSDNRLELEEERNRIHALAREVRGRAEAEGTARHAQTTA